MSIKPSAPRQENSTDFVLSAAITLHTHYINFVDQNSLSTRRCINSAQCILEAYYKLSRTSLDISRLHPFVTV